MVNAKNFIVSLKFIILSVPYVITVKHPKCHGNLMKNSSL